VSTRRRNVQAIALGLVVAALAVVPIITGVQAGPAVEAGGNSKCYVCHTTMKQESLTTAHLAVNITCDKCHGPSINHMEDEMLMTKPDLLFGRSQVVAMCARCHQGHENSEKVEAFRREWAGRMRPNGRTISAESVCTDCHGTHNLAKVEQEQQESPWQSLFNGRDLTGWRSSGPTTWSIRGGRLAAPAGGSEPATLLSDAVYEDYLLVVTFRVKFPVRAGIELRAGRQQGPRVEICRSAGSGGYTGSVSIPGKGLVLLNLRPDLFDEGAWNTISARVEGQRVQVWLNGEEIGAVHVPGPAKGKIGLQLDPQTGQGGEFIVREVQLQALAVARPENR